MAGPVHRVIARGFRQLAAHRSGRWSLGLLSLCTVAALLLAVVQLGLRLPGLDGLAGDADRGDVARGFVPRDLGQVRAELIRQRFGTGVFGLFPGAPAPTGRGGSGHGVAGPLPDGPGEPSPPESLEGGGGVTRGGWELTVEMAADRTTAAPGDPVVYSMIVRNVGDAAFPLGTNFQLQWHIPFGTRADDPVRCTPGDVFDELEQACPAVALPVPGTGDTAHSQLDSGGLVRIPAHGQWVRPFRVRVLEGTQPGTKLPNHFHLDVTGDLAGQITSNTVEVVVGSSPAVPQ